MPAATNDRRRAREIIEIAVPDIDHGDAEYRTEDRLRRP
jgi:hypothetical protein